MLTLSDLHPYARYVLEAAEIPELPNYYRGKVRDNYDLPGRQRLLIASDRISAFDQNLAAIPLKGQVLTQTARFWFEATQDICANHVLGYPDPNVLLCRRLTMMPVEIVVRGYLAGTTSTSILQMYKKGERRLYGYDFPDGMKDHQKLPRAILTPTTKGAHGTHDEPLSGDDVASRGLLTDSQWRNVSRVALALFARGSEIAAKRGLILADTKYEFGFDDIGGIVLGDEIHTPDSSRYWLAETYPAKLAAGEAPDTFDKDFVRRWVTARCDPYRDPIPEIPEDVLLQAALTYIQAFEKITGTAFAMPDLSLPPLERIRANLRQFIR
jgi:phosphoribosylaminoimidazole-succinocarboxamide synthase